MSVSIPKAKRSPSVTGYAANISGSGFCKATANVTHKIQPYVVYGTKDGGCAKSAQRWPPTRSTAWRSTSGK